MLKWEYIGDNSYGESHRVKIPVGDSHYSLRIDNYNKNEEYGATVTLLDTHDFYCMSFVDSIHRDLDELKSFAVDNTVMVLKAQIREHTEVLRMLEEDMSNA